MPGLWSGLGCPGVPVRGMAASPPWGAGGTPRPDPATAPALPQTGAPRLNRDPCGDAQCHTCPFKPSEGHGRRKLWRGNFCRTGSLSGKSPV